MAEESKNGILYYRIVNIKEFRSSFASLYIADLFRIPNWFADSFVMHNK